MESINYLHNQQDVLVGLPLVFDCHVFLYLPSQYDVVCEFLLQKLGKALICLVILC